MNKMAAMIGLVLGLTAGVTLATAGTDTGLGFGLYSAH